MSKINLNFDEILNGTFEVSNSIDPVIYLSSYFDRLKSECDLFVENQMLSLESEVEKEKMNTNRELIISYLNEREKVSFRRYEENADCFEARFADLAHSLNEFTRHSESEEFWWSKVEIEKLIEIRKKVIELRRELFGGCFLFFEGFRNVKIGSLFAIEAFGLDDLQIRVVKQKLLKSHSTRTMNWNFSELLFTLYKCKSGIFFKQMKEQNEQAPRAYALNDYLMNIYRCLKLVKEQREFEAIEVWRVERLSSFEASDFLEFQAFSSIDKMAEIHESSFKSFPHLTKLELKSNHIEKIGEEALQCLTNLSELSLRNNFIRKLKKKQFKNLHNLKKLDLSDNQLDELSVDLFKDCDSLEVLYLNLNRFKRLDQNWFRHLNSLNELYMSENAIEQLGDFGFQFLIDLRVLDLSKNRIGQLSKLSLMNLSQLRELSLRSNLIPKIEDFTFKELKCLEKLHLAKNFLKSLSKETFAGLNNLTLLDLQDNSLEKIGDKAFEDLINIRNKIYLEGNTLLPNFKLKHEWF